MYIQYSSYLQIKKAFEEKTLKILTFFRVLGVGAFVPMPALGREGG